MQKLVKEITDQRASQYGSFSLNMAMINFLKSKVSVEVENIRLSDSNYSEIKTTAEFLKTMILLKCIRSINAKGDVLKDCIIDCVNYIVLSREAINKFNKEVKLKIELDKTIFNNMLHENISLDDIENIDFLVRSISAKSIMKLLENDYK
ncbi:TPA: hypothetical protein RTG63_001718 [Campylobacter jejuni]|nr:hypothetical protein [Campylobacter jejuni]